MTEKHEHNTDGATSTHTSVVGTELVTYKKVHCTCGVLQTNDIVQRVHIAPRQSPENDK